MKIRTIDQASLRQQRHRHRNRASWFLRIHYTLKNINQHHQKEGAEFHLTSLANRLHYTLKNINQHHQKEGAQFHLTSLAPRLQTPQSGFDTRTGQNLKPCQRKANFEAKQLLKCLMKAGRGSTMLKTPLTLS